MLRSIPVALLILVVLGCAKSPTPPATPRGFSGYYRADATEKMIADEAKAISIAKTHLEKEDGKPIDAYYRVTKEDGGFSVHVQDVTGYDDEGEPIFIPGGHCWVHISKEWKVTSVSPGA
jgi:hypothetical protein